MYLLFDIGGTKMRVGVSRDHQSFGEWKVVAMPPTFAEGLAQLKNLAIELGGGQKIDAVCGGLAGNFDRPRTILLNGKHIPDWVGKPLKRELQKLFGVPVYLENDAALAGLGEAVYGAGKGKEIVAYFTVSTGTGGVRITNGKIDASAMGFEPGYQIIDAGRGFVPEWQARRLGRYISGSALEEHYGKPASVINDPNVWEQTAKILAIGLNNTIVHWSPDIIVLGGSVMKSVSIESVVAHLKDTLKPFPEAPPVVRAALGETSALWGGLAELQQGLLTGSLHNL